MIYSLLSLLAFHFSISEGLGLGAGFLSHTTALSSRTGAQLPQWSPGWSCDPGELRIRSSQRRRNPHTARDCSLGRILLHRGSAGGQGEDTARGWLWTHQWALNGRIPCNFGPSPTWPWPLPCTELTFQWTLKSCSPEFLFTFFPIYSQAPQLTSFP